MTFAEKLLNHRERLELTIPLAAELLGVSEKTYWNWETTEKSPLPVTCEGSLERLRKCRDYKAAIRRINRQRRERENK